MGNDSVLKRSFSALLLSSMAEREAKAPFMGVERYHQLVDEAVAYLQGERDLRGYDAKLGWIHANAHTADLLQALAKSSLLTKGEEQSMLAALAARLSSAPQVYTQGEQDRMAAAVLAVIRRPSFDAASFDVSELRRAMSQIAREDIRFVPVIACAFADDELEKMFKQFLPDNIPGGGGKKKRRKGGKGGRGKNQGMRKWHGLFRCPTIPVLEGSGQSGALGLAVHLAVRRSTF